jgi:hypothetical protein
VKAALEQALKARLEPATIVHDGPGQLGARRVDSFELSGFGAPGRIRALAIVEDTRHRTYSVTVLTPLHPSKKRVDEVSRILGSVRFTKPESLASKR